MRSLRRVFNTVLTAGIVASLSVTAPGSATADIGCSIIASPSNYDPGLTAVSDGLVDVFFVNSGESLGRLRVNAFTRTVVGGGNLGGVARSEPAATSWGTGHSIVFVRGSDGALWYLQFDNGTETGWQSLGGQITWNPHVVSNGPGHLIVFYRGTNRQLWYLEYVNGVWGPHTSLGGVLTSSPIAVSWGPGHVAVFTRGQANDLWYRQRVGSAWSDWIGLGGNFGVDPIVVSRGAGLMDVFARSGPRVIRNSFNGSSWSSWLDLGIPPSGAVSEPGAVATPGELTVFVRGGRWEFNLRPIWRNVSFDGGATWTGWTGLDAPYAEPSANNPEATANIIGGGIRIGWSMAAINFPSGARVGQLRFCSSL